ncbi:MAG: SH3 domain-containing protein [Clostridia bacterium]|nr:SH3 domain-containing protein [Clostridia bacterium]
MKKRILCIVTIISVLLTFFSFTSFAAANGVGYYRTTTAVNLRGGAGTSYSKLTTVPKGVTVNVTQISGVWGYTTYDGKTGWLSLDYATKTDGPADYSSVNVLAQLDRLRQKFPDGKHWNHVGGTNDPDSWTDIPCTCHGGTCVIGSCDCNVFGGTFQCHGFALKLGYEIFGSMPSTWEKRYTLDDICVGDIIRYRNNGHTVMVTDIAEEYLVVVDCNWDYHCGIDWDRPMAKSRFTNINYIYHAPGNICKGNNDFSPPTLGLSASIDSAGVINIDYSVSDSAKLDYANISVIGPDGVERYVENMNYGYEQVSVSGTACMDLYDYNYQKGTYTVKLYAYDWFDNYAEKTVTVVLNSDITFTPVSYNFNLQLEGIGNQQDLDYYIYTNVHNNANYDYRYCSQPGSLEITNERYYVKIAREGYTSYIRSTFYGGTDTLPDEIVLYAGDANGDNVVNAKDISVLLSLYGPNDDEYIGHVDFNDDGYVNAKDMSAMLGNFGKTGTSN